MSKDFDFAVKFAKAYLITELTSEGETFKLQLQADIHPYPQKCTYPTDVHLLPLVI
jgi:hypothetical protein